MSYNELLQSNREEILRIAAKYGASSVRIFGSVARGEADQRVILTCLWIWNLDVVS